MKPMMLSTIGSLILTLWAYSLIFSLLGDLWPPNNRTTFLSIQFTERLQTVGVMPKNKAKVFEE